MKSGNEQYLVCVLEAEGPDLEEICTRYWAVDEAGAFIETVTAIGKSFGLTAAKLGRFVKENSYAYSLDIACPRCNRPIAFRSRAEFQAEANRITKECEDCKLEMVQQKNQEKERQLRERQQAAIEECPDVTSFTTEQCIYLLALLKLAATEDMMEISELSTIQYGMFTPTKDLDHQALKSLLHSGIIYISPTSHLTSIEITEKGISYYIDSVRWRVSLQDKGCGPIYAVLEDEIRQRLSCQGPAILMELCHEISLHECLAFLDESLSEHRLGYEYGEKTVAVLRAALEQYPVAKVYNFIWRSARDAAAFYQRKQTSKAHASRTVVGSIERQCQQALANSWDVKAYKRNFRMPQSSLSRVVFNTLLGTDDAGFNILIKELFSREG
ncbi:hypothetical protein [Stutzerimonas nitrititolerans]|uniref:hypothetical protein n=1 Tax=Stutzerimonas nitrititolerans TaxID=2482751 RepID=UPI002898DA83|nr:hypothetical protein [Stutzerimonas nitrititolerans]